MLVLKKVKLLFLFPFVIFFMTPVFANECIDDFDNHSFDQVLFFNGCELADENLNTIVNYANQHPGIERLFLDNNNLTDKGIEQLSLLNNTVKEIYISNNKIQGKTLASLCNLEIDTLFIENNPIDSSGINKLLLNQYIKNLWIGSDALDDGIANNVINRNFDILGIESNYISSAAWQKIATFSHAMLLLVNGKNVDDNFAGKISKNTYIQILYLKNNAISGHGFRSIFNNPHIHGLETSTFNESSTFLEPLANSLYLKSLFVNPEEDIILTASTGKYLAKNKSLETLIFTPIGNHRFVLDADFSDAISKTGITNFMVYGYEIDDAAAVAIAKSRHLKHLDIEYGKISNEGAIALAHNQFLADLILSDNKISDQGALAFINNEYLDSLNLSYNPISKFAAEKLLANSRIKNITIDLDNEMQTSRKFNNKYNHLLPTIKYYLLTNSMNEKVSRLRR